jgi:hypothetical protein
MDDTDRKLYQEMLDSLNSLAGDNAHLRERVEKLDASQRQMVVAHNEWVSVLKTHFEAYEALLDDHNVLRAQHVKNVKIAEVNLLSLRDVMWRMAEKVFASSTELDDTRNMLTIEGLPSIGRTRQ